MTATESFAGNAVPMADPAARLARRDDGGWRIWLGWAAAAMLHAGLLAALIFSWPAKLSPAPPNPAAISLLITAAEKPASQPAIRPKPSAKPSSMPAGPPAIFANSPTQTKAAPVPKPALHASAVKTAVPAQHPVPVARGAVEAKAVPQQDDDGFVAAQPLSGNVNQPPEYPEQAYAHGEQGDVLLSIHVLTDGAAEFSQCDAEFRLQNTR